MRDLIQDLSQAKPLPALWSKTARTWFAQTLKEEEQRLAAQAAVQDVLDGCEPCRAPLRAWLRLSLGEGQLLLQAPEELGCTRPRFGQSKSLVQGMERFRLIARFKQQERANELAQWHSEYDVDLHCWLVGATLCANTLDKALVLAAIALCLLASLMARINGHRGCSGNCNQVASGP